MQLEKSAENLGAGDGEPGEASPGGVQGDPSSLKRLLAVPGIVAIFVLLNFTVRAILATLETLSTYTHTHLGFSPPDFVDSSLHPKERISEIGGSLFGVF